MSKMKKALLMVTAYALVAVLAIGGTLAYLTSTDSDVNVMTLGNVSIEQIEQERVDGTKGELIDNLKEFAQEKGAYPYTGKVDANGHSNGGYDFTDVKWDADSDRTFKLFTTANNVVDKFVTVKNNGKSDAFVRTLIAFEEGTEGHLVGISANINDKEWTWNWLSDYIEIDGSLYSVAEVIYKTELKAGATTLPSLLQVYLNAFTTNEDMEALGETWNILVLSQAVQVAGFENADDAFDAVSPISDEDVVVKTAAEIALDTAFGDVTEVKAAEWFKGVKSAYFVPSNAVKIGSDITCEDFADLLATGKNIYLTESITIANPESSRFTEFDVDGEVGIWAADGATLTFSETTGLTGDGTLTVYSGSIDEKQELWVGGNATLVFEGGEHSFAAFSVSSNGKIVVNDGTLNCLGTYAGIMGITFGENGSLEVNGGKINLYQPINLNPNRCDAAYIEINGGEFELLNNIENLFVVRNKMDKDQTSGVLRGSSIRITDGTFIAHYEIDSAGDATSFIRNGDAPADGNKVLVSNADGYNCVVTGGTFYGSWQRADNTRYVDGNGGYADGNMVDNSIAGFVADGYKITGDATNGYVVSAN